MRVCVIGGGAAGMTAAIYAKREGSDVTILEAGDRVGRKILSTGNGKCNLGNLHLDENCYYGKDKAIPMECLRRCGTRETIGFFRELGLLITEKNGYLYPLSETASSVLDVLRYEVTAGCVKIRTLFRTEKIIAEPGGGFHVYGAGEKLFFDRVIVACGGRAAPKTGSDGSGYRLAEQLGLRLVPVVPALTHLVCEGDFFRSISGVRTQAKISLTGEGGEVLASERGELQLTDYGLSGIPVFQISRVASYALLQKRKLFAEVDFLPDHEPSELKKIAKERREQLTGRSVEEYFTGILNKKLMQLFIRRAGLKGTEPSENYSEQQLFQVFIAAKNMKIAVCKTGDFQHAQVCAGGVDFSQVSSDLESKRFPGLFFAGEILDIDGKCGGYNLQWAWTSGCIAGQAAGRKKMK